MEDPDHAAGQHQEMKVPPLDSEGAVERNPSIQESGYAMAASEEQTNTNGMAQQQQPPAKETPTQAEMDAMRQ